VVPPSTAKAARGMIRFIYFLHRLVGVRFAED